MFNVQLGRITNFISLTGSRGPLTIPPNVVAKNHLFSAFLSATKSQNFVQKDNDLIFFWKIGPKNDNDLFPPKICPEILKMHGNALV